MTGSLDRDRLGRLLDALNDRLRRANVRASLYLVGGAAMLLAYGRTRATSDVDVRIDAANEAVTAAVADVAAEHGLEYDWLNQHAAACIPRVADRRARGLIGRPLTRRVVLGSSLSIAGSGRPPRRGSARQSTIRSASGSSASRAVIPMATMPTTWPTTPSTSCTSIPTPATPPARGKPSCSGRLMRIICAKSGCSGSSTITLAGRRVWRRAKRPSRRRAPEYAPRVFGESEASASRRAAGVGRSNPSSPPQTFDPRVASFGDPDLEAVEFGLQLPVRRQPGEEGVDEAGAAGAGGLLPHPANGLRRGSGTTPAGSRPRRARRRTRGSARWVPGWGRGASGSGPRQASPHASPR